MRAAADPYNGLPRRVFVAGAGAVAVAALTGCATPDRSRGGSASGSGRLGSTSEIPVGGGAIFSAQEVVVTQPSAGTFCAFSSICPHQGCLVTEVVDNTITCPCHGSQFAAADGAVLRGPAQQPLPPREVTVDGGSLRLV